MQTEPKRKIVFGSVFFCGKILNLRLNELVLVIVTLKTSLSPLSH